MIKVVVNGKIARVSGGCHIGNGGGSCVCHYITTALVAMDAMLVLDISEVIGGIIFFSLFL